ncbi:MAG: phosphoribosylanthranilate isomerase, partial [Allosphingosinicella sp.]
EVHDEAQLELALRLGTPIIGINNRDLKTLQVDLEVTERLAPQIPKDRLVIAESGIQGRADVERLAGVVDGFLVGTALMRAADPERAARELAFGRVKVCGLTDPRDARLAAGGASHAGMIFVPESLRHIRCADALPVAQAIRAGGLKSVGVFRNGKVMEVAATARALGLDIVQLHGEEDPAYIAALRNLVGRETEIWAVSAVGAHDPQRRPGADRTLYDTASAGRSGGTGIPFDWSRLQGGEELGTDVVAGGLSPDNAAAAAKLGAYALDVNSGVESAPGRKDAVKLRAFFEALRPRARAEAMTCA